MKKNTGLAEVFAQKAEARKKLARLPIEEKMEIARRLNEAGRYAPGFLNRGKRPSEKFISSLRAVTNKKRSR